MDNYQNLYNELANELKQTDDQLETENIMLNGLNHSLDHEQFFIGEEMVELEIKEHEEEVLQNYNIAMKNGVKKGIKRLLQPSIWSIGLFTFVLTLFPGFSAEVIWNVTTPNAIINTAFLGWLSGVCIAKSFSTFFAATKEARTIKKKYPKNSIGPQVGLLKQSIQLRQEKISSLSTCIRLYENSLKRLGVRKDELDNQIGQVFNRRMELLENLAASNESSLNQSYASDETVEVIKLERGKKGNE